jgi:hypothetical protein
VQSIAKSPAIQRVDSFDYEDHPLYQALVRDLPKEVIDRGALYENGDALIEAFVSGAWEVRDEREEMELSDMGHPVAQP